MARHCSSVTVVGVGPVCAVLSIFSGDPAGEICGTGDADGTFGTGKTGGAGDAVAAVSDGFASSGGVFGAASGTLTVAAVFESCSSLLLEPSVIAMRTIVMAFGWGFMTLPKML